MAAIGVSATVTVRPAVLTRGRWTYLKLPAQLLRAGFDVTSVLMEQAASCDE